MRLRLLMAPLLGLAIALIIATPALADHSRHGGYHAQLSGADHLRYSADPRQRHYRPFLRDNRRLRHYSRPLLRDNRGHPRHYSRPFLRDNRGHPRHYSRPFLRDDNRGHPRHYSRPFLRDNRHHRGGFRSGRHLTPKGIAPRRPLHLPNHRFDQRRYRAPSRHGPSFRIRID
ncbi:hypothetical protein [Halomonas cerina]|uniref:Uncharacterized protein n=1 Tax=Halomonas cerina TaxID=447424 RepID=A0A839VIS7_9GAMM|nr:hypothetical protein [Halomonas cerina]MBB3192286.1 hypothetical protein [Halomonas cerina]